MIAYFKLSVEKSMNVCAKKPNRGFDFSSKRTDLNPFRKRMEQNRLKTQT